MYCRPSVCNVPNGELKLTINGQPFFEMVRPSHMRLSREINLKRTRRDAVERN